MMRFNRAVLLTVAVSLVACGSPTQPSSQAVVTFRVSNESFKALLTTPTQVVAARMAQAGGRAAIPNGRIVFGTQVNSGWSWDLEDIEVSEFTMQVCAGLP